MIKLTQETNTKRYTDEGVYCETKMEFHYDTESEMIKHSRKMQINGFMFNDSSKDVISYRKNEFVPM